MFKKISFLILLFIAINAEAAVPPPASAPIDSWLLLLIIGIGLPILALFFNQK